MKYSLMKELSNLPNVYPVILVSNEMWTCLNAEIPLPISKPTEPYNPSFDWNFGGFYVVIFLSIVFSLVLYFLLEVEFQYLVLIYLLFLSILIITFFVTVIKRIRYFLHWKKNYRIHLPEFEKEQDNYNNVVLSIRNPEDTIRYRLEKVAKLIENPVKPNQTSNYTNGFSESYFGNYLFHWFPERIFTGYTIVRKRGHTYQPDFIYQDDKNLHIDIEIDESYILGTKAPIHYRLESYHQDSFRDSFYTDFIGWVVVRFTEEQVIKYPNECCKVLAEVIEKITGNTTYYDKLREYGSLPTQNAWTKDEAIQSSNSMKREEYLKSAVSQFNIGNTWNNSIKLGPEPDFQKIDEAKRIVEEFRARKESDRRSRRRY